MGLFVRSTVFLRRAATVGLAAALSAGLSGQTTLMEPTAPLLPQHFGAWQMQGQTTTGTDADQIDSEHKAALKEDGLDRFSMARYARGAATLDMQALQFVDATGASAALSLYRSSSPGLRSLPPGQKLGAESAAGDGAVLFRTGNTVVLARAAHAHAEELQALAISLPKISGPKGMSPLLPTLLPVKGLDPDSLRYALGPASYAATGGVLPPEILGFGKSAEAATAHYVSGAARETLTLLLYPTPQIAGDRGRAVEAWVNQERHGQQNEMSTKLRREGPLVLLATGSFPPEEAQRIIENIHLRSEVTWNKPMPHEFHAEVRKTASLLVSIAVLSGVLMLAAVVLGLFLGVGRASLRVLMGKPAAAEPDFQGLGLARGPVKAISQQDHPASG